MAYLVVEAQAAEWQMAVEWGAVLPLFSVLFSLGAFALHAIQALPVLQHHLVVVVAGRGSLPAARWTEMMLSVTDYGTDALSTHLRAPFRRILSCGTMFGLNTHEFSDFTEIRSTCYQKCIRGTYYWRARLSSLSFPTSASKMRTSLARALLKSLMYLKEQIKDDVSD